MKQYTDLCKNYAKFVSITTLDKKAYRKYKLKILREMRPMTTKPTQRLSYFSFFLTEDMNFVMCSVKDKFL